MVAEEKVFISNENLIIEALMHKSASERGVIVCHPHPLMGGSMHNNVVEAVVRTFAAENFTTLRFNFRGVGASTGSYEEGKGESCDIIAVCRYLQQSGLSQIYFAGYSFGAWVGALVMEQREEKFSYSLFISPPHNYFPFNFNNLKNKLNLIICGNSDEFCHAENLKKRIKGTRAHLEIISGANHFYWGKEKEIEDILRKHLVKYGKIFCEKKVDFK
ncbi:MAG TPA: alpha/beta fold hydrolase [Smithellaceae bacterium]|jgi:alpha/beta superfamily hydrolase|nr:alpha/beta fold hydrolase [Smithellaceae bacterium]